MCVRYQFARYTRQRRGRFKTRFCEDLSFFLRGDGQTGFMCPLWNPWVSLGNNSYISGKKVGSLFVSNPLAVSNTRGGGKQLAGHAGLARE